MKTCTRCRAEKPITAFYASRQWLDGRHPYCKQCLLAYQRERRRERLDQENPTRRRWSAGFVRHDYFATLDRPIQAYVAGLLAADGNVLERQKRVSLELSYRDRELVSLVRDELAPEFPICERTRPNGARTTTLAITSPELCADLARFGITPRKSLTLEWPTTLSRNQTRPFLLGYFDGDGFITWSQTDIYTYPRWGLRGTESFLSDAMDVIAESTQVRGRNVRLSPTAQVHLLPITGRDAWIVDRWLHADGELGLKRKRLIRNYVGTAVA